jgi:EmrB/QacA subfamily drug resistance transporter
MMFNNPLYITKKWWVLIGVGISSMIVTIDFTIVNTVLLDIQRYFSTSMNALQWVMTGFGITFTSLLVTAGRLGDSLGHRRLLYIGMIGFGIASLITGLANSMEQLILGRLLQGAFGSAIFPCGMAITASVFPKEQGRALGIYGSLLGIGLAIGPVLGGIMTTLANWHWIFLINIPIILISFLICLLVVDESPVKENPTIDWCGILLISLGLTTFVFAITQSHVYGWTSWIISVPLILSFLLFIVLFKLESKMAMPLLPPALFMNHSFFIGAAVYIVGVSFISPILFFIPLYLQKILHLSVVTTGFLLLPMTVMTVIAPAISGILYDKQGPFYTTMFTFSMSILGLILFLFFPTTLSFTLIIAAFIFIGSSSGIANGIAIPLVLSNGENKQNEGLISGTLVTVLNLFSVLSLSVASTLFNYIQQEKLAITCQALPAFMSGFHAVIWLLLILTMIVLFGVLRAYQSRQQWHLAHGYHSE